MAKGKSNKTAVIGISGSISAYRMCDLILDLKENQVEVLPVLSKDAHHFVTPLTIQSLAGHEVYQEFFSLEGRVKPVHTELARKADIILLSPASADLIARVSLGLSDDLLSCTVLASDCPVVVAPAMNDKMYENPATQEHLKRLRDRGYKIIDPVKGKLVCTDFAMGHIADNEVILKEVLSILKGKKTK